MPIAGASRQDAIIVERTNTLFIKHQDSNYHPLLEAHLFVKEIE